MTGPLALFESLGDRYRLEREIGVGGMATVYLAHDLRHGRPVAVNVFRPEVRESLGADRFLREIQIAAQLHHPHILALHDSGEAAGYLYYLMPFVDGETLRARLRRDGPLPIDVALHITREVADALGYAHRRGVIHRDIKPENILLADGHAFVADFGIARAVDSATQSLTQTGFALGTPAYMAPEQAVGERELDGRADLYALGCVLYEMLAGTPPFTGPSMHAIVAQQLTASPPLLTSLRTEISPAIDSLIRRTLAVQPELRPQSMHEFLGLLGHGVIEAGASGGPSLGDPLRPESAPFVGRARELKALEEQLDRAGKGVGSLCLLGGEPGIGKTRLAEHALREARRRGFLIATGQCLEMEGAAAPFQPFVEQVEAIAGAVTDASLWQLLGEAAPEVAQMVPSLRSRLPGIAPAADLPPDQQRHLRFKMFREFLGRAAHSQPLALLLDDLQWADDSTLLLLEHLAPHLHVLPIVVLGTYRDIELDVQRPFARTLERLLRQRYATRVALKALPEHDVAALLNGLAGTDVPTALVEAINRETDGNPFFCEEVYRHLVEGGHLRNEDGSWRPAVDLAQVDVPEGVRLVVGQRLERLAGGTRAILATAAVIGPSFQLSVLASTEGLASGALLDVLEEVERAGLIRTDVTAGRVDYRFAHELIRSTLLSSLSLPRRQARHLAIAEAIEREASVGPALLASLAYHSFQAGAAMAPSRAAAHLTAAAEEATARGAFTEAGDLGEKALALMPSDPSRARARLLATLGVARQGGGDLVAAIDCYRRSFAFFADDKDVASLGNIAEVATWLMAWRADFAGVTAMAERALTLLGEEDSHYGPLLATLGWVCAVTGDYARGVAMLDTARAAAERCGEARAIGLVHFWRGGIATHYGMQTSSGNSYRHALREAERGNDRALVSLSLGALLYEAWVGGHPERAGEIGSRLRTIGESIGDPSARWFDDFLGVMTRWRDGDLAGMKASAATFIEQHSAFGPHGQWTGKLWLELVRFWSGDWDGIPERLLTLAEAFPPDYYWRGAFLGPTLLVSQYVDGGSTAPFSLATPYLPTGQPMVVGNWFVLPNLVEAHVIAGRHAEAASLHASLVEAIELGLVVTYTGLVETSAGIAAGCGGEWDVAERHFEAAWRLASDGSYLMCRPEVQRWWAWTLARRGRPEDRPRVEALVADAMANYRALGMSRHIELAARITGTAS